MAGSPHTQVAFRHRIGSLALEVSFATDAAWTVLFGPSGSGKSTTLRALAGVVRPDAGRIVLGDEVVFDSEEGIWVPPHERRMRWSPQRAMLNPQKTAGWNLQFALPPTLRSPDHLQSAAAAFGLGELDRTADRLSGGERQRLAVVRAALAGRGDLLLLDEPFTGMDAAVRGKLMGDLRAWIGAAPVVSVTHDVGEAFLLQAEVVKIADGRVVAQGPVGDVLSEERAQLGKWLG